MTGTGGATGGASAASGGRSNGGASGGGGSPASGGSSSVPDAGRSCGSCTAYGSTRVAGTVPSVLTELSGLAASHMHPGVIYMHNDSGDSPRFFAMSDTAANLGQFSVQGASAADWEDIAVGPCPDGSCVFLGDIGDNPETRQQYVVYRVPEPVVTVGNPVGTITVTGQRLPFVYPDGSHNSETLLANPRTGDLYVVTKVTTRAKVYRFPTPFTPGQQATLVLVGDLALDASAGVITGGDLSPCENRLLIRTYGSLYEFVGPTSPFEAVFSATPKQVPVASEPQGEAVAYRFDGAGYFTASEGNNVPLDAVGCQ